MGPAEPRLDFFVSHAGSDEDWAKWLAQQLQNAGYTVELDVWNWSAGIDVIQVTQRALDRASRMLAVWTPEYFTRQWADMEHRVSFARSQLQPGWLLPVVVRACPIEVIPVLYRTLIWVDLVGLSEVEAREKLLAAVEGPTRPTHRQPYPGEVGRDAYPGRLPPIWNVPNRNPFFIGREVELEELAEHLASPGAAAAVTGPDGTSGVGKSELAVEYAWRHASQYRMVWWMDAGHQASAEASLVELAALLDVPARGGTTLVSALRAELDRRADWLLIMDNVPDRDRLAAALPSRSGRVIVTSRDGGVLPSTRPVVVGPFGRAESVRLLRRRCSWLSQQAADRIAAIVEDLPVAVAQAAQFLARTAMAADEYLPRLIEQVASGPERGAEAGLAATVALAQERLLELDPAAADLLNQLALLADEPVPLTAAAFDAPGAVTAPGLVVSDPETTSELVSSICGLGLAVRIGTQIQLQARVRPLIAGALAGQRLVLALGRVLRLLATADPGDPAVTAAWPLYAAIAPHVEAVTARLSGTAGITEPRAFQRLLDHVCQYLRLAGLAGDGYRLADAAHRRHRTTHGDDDPHTLRWEVNCGAALAAMGRHQQAKEVLEDALARQRRRAGADHLDTLHAAGRLGVTLTALGEHEAARTLLHDVLVRRRSSLGPDSPETLRSAADLGVALTALGYHAQARRLFEDVTAARRRLLGENHLDTLASAHELGVVLAVVGDHDAARGVLEQVVDGRRSALGPDHLDTLVSAHRLGTLLATIGDYEAARVLLDDTVTRRREALGDEHVDTLASAHELGVVLAVKGHHEAARDVMSRVVDGRRSTLSADHQDTLASAHHLGVALSALGDLDAAREVLSDIAVRRRRALGPSHPDTLETERALRWL